MYFVVAHGVARKYLVELCFLEGIFRRYFSMGACIHRFVLLIPVVDRLSLDIRSTVSVDFACFCTTQYYGRQDLIWLLIV